MIAYLDSMHPHLLRQGTAGRPWQLHDAVQALDGADGILMTGGVQVLRLLQARQQRLQLYLPHTAHMLPALQHSQALSAQSCDS